MTISHGAYSEPFFSTGSEFADHAATNHETRRRRPEQAQAVQAGMAAVR